MKREDLRKIGLTDEQVDQVMSMNGDYVNAQKAIVAQRDEAINALTTERDGLKEQVTARDKDISDLKKTAGENNALTQQLTELQKKYSDDTAAFKQKLDAQRTEFETQRAIDSFFKDVAFSSSFARDGVIAEFKSKGFKLTDGVFQGGKEWITELKKNSPDAFKADNADNAGGNPLPSFTKSMSNYGGDSAGGAGSFGGGGNGAGFGGGNGGGGAGFNGAGWNFQQVRGFEQK